MHYQIKNVLLFTEEDNYGEGCNPDTSNTVGIDVTFEGGSQEEVIKQFKNFFDLNQEDLELNACDCLGRIDGQVLLTCDHLRASPEQIKQWKKGEIKLYLGTYSAYLERVIACKIKEEVVS